MELKKVEKYEMKNYAKKNEISKNEMKKATPVKWMMAGAIGAATLMYTGISDGVSRIGVVFGCVELEEVILNPTPLWLALDKVHTIIYYLFLVSTFYLLFSLVITGMEKLSKGKNEINEKNKKLLIKTWIIACIIILLFIGFTIFLKSDLSIFFEGGVKQVETSGIVAY